MPIYMYTARNREGRLTHGRQEAPSEVAVVHLLQNNGLYVTQIVNAAVGVKVVRKTVKKRRNRVTPEDLIFFISQTGNLLTVGIPFMRAMEVIADQIESVQLYKVILKMIENVKAGSTFKDALARHPNVFPQYWTFLVEAGELSGTLPAVLSQMAKTMEANERLKKKIVSALVYPAVLVIAAILAVTVFMVFIIPVFERLFDSFHAKLPPLTAGIIAVSKFLRAYFIVLTLGVVVGVYFLRRYLSAGGGQKSVNLLLLSLPVFGDVVSDIIHARVCMILAMLIRSGLSFLKSLEVSAHISGNYVFEIVLNNTRLDVQQGKTLSASLSESSIFSPMFVNLVRIGEESGKLPEMLEKASEYFQSRVDVFAARVGVLIEPLVLILIGGIVGTIVVAMFLPIMNLSTTVH